MLYSIIDCKFQISTYLQHKSINDFAIQNDESIGFYGSEDYNTVNKSLYLKHKIDNIDQLYNGIIIFSISQYSHSSFLFEAINKLLEKNKIFLAAEEKIIIRNKYDYERNFDMIYFIAKSCREDDVKNYMKNIIE
jgi:hypothetical protein